MQHYSGISLFSIRFVCFSKLHIPETNTYVYFALWSVSPQHFCGKP